ncbi:MAG: beta-phosphoglucomutase [Oscillospiraceae bacterium]
MIKAVIFDLDGVLVSTDDLHYRAWKALADREGIWFDREINNRLRGVSRMESLEIILERARRAYSPEEKQEMCAYKNSLYVELLASLSPADRLPGVDECLARLRREGYRLAVGSSSKNTKRILSRIELQDSFDAVADGTDITRSKPDPEVFLVAAARLGTAPESCAVVEDAEAGIRAAKAGGMTACAVGDAKKSPLADMTLDSLSELPDQLRKIG